MMQLQNQVTSLELSKRLRELNVKQESIFRYHEYEHGMEIEFDPSGTELSAFTVAELGEMLKESDYELPWFFKHEVAYPTGAWQWSTISEDSIEMTERDARAAMLIYLLEQGLLTINEK